MIILFYVIISSVELDRLSEMKVTRFEIIAILIRASAITAGATTTIGKAEWVAERPPSVQSFGTETWVRNTRWQL
jgi:hypothetical protein